MNRTHILLVVAIVVVVSLAVWIGVFRESTVPEAPPGGQDSQSADTVYVNTSDDAIAVSLPFPGAVVGKAFGVIGEARGWWFFEASFPVEVIDQNGAIIGTAIAEAESDWMTENFVPFRANIALPESFIGTATLVLRRDNPSGLPENDAFIAFPIVVEY